MSGRDDTGGGGPREKALDLMRRDRAVAAVVARDSAARLCAGFPPGLAADLRSEAPAVAPEAFRAALLGRGYRGEADREARESDAEWIALLAGVCRQHGLTWAEVDAAPTVEAAGAAARAFARGAN